jgi:hypothetical protein
MPRIETLPVQGACQDAAQPETADAADPSQAIAVEGHRLPSRGTSKVSLCSCVLRISSPGAAGPGGDFVCQTADMKDGKLTVVEEEAERAAIPVSDRDRTDAQCRDGVANKAMIALGQRAITRRVKPWQMAKLVALSQRYSAAAAAGWAIATSTSVSENVGALPRSA